MQQKSYADFAHEWVQAWNSLNIEDIMSHYSEDLEFSSPIIKQMGVNEQGTITDKEELKNYFSKALQKYPDLKFELHYVLSGVNSLVLYYKSINNMFAAEYMELNNEGKVTRVKAHYAAGK